MFPKAVKMRETYKIIIKMTKFRLLLRQPQILMGAPKPLPKRLNPCTHPRIQRLNYCAFGVSLLPPPQLVMYKCTKLG